MNSQLKSCFTLEVQEERAALEEKVTQQLEAEKRALLARKRAQQEERRRKAEDLERILQENQRKVQSAGASRCLSRLWFSCVIREPAALRVVRPGVRASSAARPTVSRSGQLPLPPMQCFISGVGRVQVEEAQKKAALALEREGRKEGGQPKWQNQGLRIVEDP